MDDAGRTVPEKMVSVVVRMPADLHAALKDKAQREERTMAQAIRHALRLYVGEGA